MACDKIRTCSDICNCLVLESPDGSILIEKLAPTGGCAEGNCKFKLTANIDLPTEFEETVTTLTWNNGTRTLTYTNEAGTIVNHVMHNDLQHISINGTIITLDQGGGSVDIASLFTETTFAATSSSLVITPGGTHGHTPNIEITPSTDAGNIFVLGSDNFPFVPGVCSQLPSVFGTDNAQNNTVTQSTYDFLALNTTGSGCRASKLSPPTGFAVTGATRQSAFGAMEWYLNLTTANAAAVSGETVLIYTDTSENLIPKNGINYVGIGVKKINNVSIASNAPYKGTFINLDIQGTVNINSDTEDVTEIYTSAVIVRGDFTLGGFAKWFGGKLLDNSKTNSLSGDCEFREVYTERYTSAANAVIIDKLVLIDKALTSRTGALFVNFSAVPTSGRGPKITNSYVYSDNNNAIYINNQATAGVIMTNTTGISESNNGIAWHNGTETSTSLNIFTHCTGRSTSGNGLYIVRQGLHADTSSLTQFVVSHNTGYSKEGYGIFSISANLKFCTGFSSESDGIRLAGSDFAYLNTNIIECIGESMQGHGLSATRDIHVLGGTYITSGNTSTSFPIALQNDVTRPVEGYAVVGVKTVARHASAYAVGRVGGVAVTARISGCQFTNPYVASPVAGIDPLITVPTLNIDGYNNVS